jgi:hypothetical protein
MYNSASKSWKSARLDTYHGIIYSYKDQLYGLRFAYGEDDEGKYQVIRIGL